MPRRTKLRAHFSSENSPRFICLAACHWDLKGIMTNVVRLKYYSFCRSGIFFNEKTNRDEIYINSRFHSKPKITKARPNKGSNKYYETSAEKEMITHVFHRKFRNNRFLKNWTAFPNDGRRAYVRRRNKILLTQSALMFTHLTLRVDFATHFQSLPSTNVAFMDIYASLLCYSKTGREVGEFAETIAPEIVNWDWLMARGNDLSRDIIQLANSSFCECYFRMYASAYKIFMFRTKLSVNLLCSQQCRRHKYGVVYHLLQKQLAGKAQTFFVWNCMQFIQFKCTFISC